MKERYLPRLLSLLFFVLMPLNVIFAQTTDVQARLDQLAANLKAAQAQAESTRQQMLLMQEEIQRLRQQVVALKGTSNPASGASDSAVASSSVAGNEQIQETTDALQAAVEQQQQTKVESDSRFPIRFTGMVVVNAFANRGVPDEIDLPTSALQAGPNVSAASTGASLRQSILGFEGTGPKIYGAATSARISMDFFGGVTASASNGLAGLARLRTAAVAADWKRDRIAAVYDSPIISPLSPESLSTVAQPSMAWSGNLWVWMPQLSWRHTQALSGTKQFAVEAGLVDTQTLNSARTSVLRPTGAGEASGQPGYESRLSFAAGETQRRLEAGVGTYYGRQTYSGHQHVDTWAVTADLSAPLTSHLRLSGELYRGRGLGSLGGGAYRDVVSYNFDHSTATYLRALDAEGGWIQLSYRFTPTVRINTSIGQDSANGAELRSANQSTSTNPLFFYARNRTIVTNMIFQPWSSILISPEYRRLQSWQIVGGSNIVTVYSLNFGYRF